MKESSLTILFFIIAAILTMGLQCHKDFVAPKPVYEFVEKLTLTPYKKTYAINDTIWVQFQTAEKKLFDKLSNSKISMDTTFLQHILNYELLYPIGNAPEFFCDVKLDNVIDKTFTTLYAYYNVLSFRTDCSNNPYFFKIGFIPKKKGVYSIRPKSYVSVCPNKLSYPYLTFKFIFDLADCNKDVFLSIPNIGRSGQIGFVDVNIDNKELFVFKVE